MLQRAMEGKWLSWPVGPCAGVPWSEEEHRTFLLGLQKLGKVRSDLLANLPTKHLGDIYDRLSTKHFSQAVRLKFCTRLFRIHSESVSRSLRLSGPALPFGRGRAGLRR